MKHDGIHFVIVMSLSLCIGLVESGLPQLLDTADRIINIQAPGCQSAGPAGGRAFRTWHVQPRRRADLRYITSELYVCVQS